MSDFAKLEPFFLETPTIWKPSIKGWNRLEGRPRQHDFERSLRAEVRDPLWMLTRQWQYGEFQGEDAGSPVEARILTHQTFLNQYAVGSSNQAQPLSASVPLEARVERETWPDDLGQQLRLGRYFEKLLKLNALSAFKTKYLAQYPISLNPPVPVFHQESDQTRAATAGRVINGCALLKEIQSGAHQSWVNADVSMGVADREALQKAAEDLAKWAAQFATQPTSAADNAWSGSHLEYQFACASQDSDGKQTVLRAEQYENGQLDWYSFDVETRTTLQATAGTNIPIIPPQTDCLSFLPVPVSFNGMPHPRYWQIENGNTEFGHIEANTTDIIKLILAEFMLLYSNDWCVFPYERQVGSICAIQGLVVKDVFGKRTLIKAAGSGLDDDWKRWRFLAMSTNDQAANLSSFLPPTLGKPLESNPLEKVNFIRDEMANLVWGIESIIPSPLGRGINGYEMAVAAQNATLSMPVALLPTEAKIRYVLGNSVPFNWTPFVAVHVPGNNRDIQLQRARMPEQSEGFRGKILDEPAPYFVHEEEVPRSGKIVTRTHQRTRNEKGEVINWIGRKATVGKGEGSSGLLFDQIKDVD